MGDRIGGMGGREKESRREVATSSNAATGSEDRRTKDHPKANKPVTDVVCLCPPDLGPEKTQGKKVCESLRFIGEPYN